MHLGIVKKPIKMTNLDLYFRLVGEITFDDITTFLNFQAS